MHYNCILLIENYISNFFLILSISYFTRAKIMHLRMETNQILTEMIFSQKFTPKHSSEHLYNAAIKRNDSYREMFVRSFSSRIIVHLFWIIYYDVINSFSVHKSENYSLTREGKVQIISFIGWMQFCFKLVYFY